MLTPGAHRSPGRSPVSPHPSYYSASDIPNPSPLPPARYSYYNPNPGPTFVAEPVPVEDPRTPTSLHPPQLDRHTNAPSPSDSDAYEMQVRSPPPTAYRGVGSRSPYLRAGSQASETSVYATASEKWDDDDDQSTINQDHDGRRDSSYSTSPRAL